jgi:hypothetical protein
MFRYVKERKGKYKDVIEDLEQQAEVFKEMLEKDYFIQELTLVSAEKERRIEAMEFDLDRAVEQIHVSSPAIFLLSNIKMS